MPGIDYQDDLPTIGATPTQNPNKAWSSSDGTTTTGTDSSTPSPDSSLLPPANESRSDSHTNPVLNDCWLRANDLDENMPWWRAGEREDLVISGISGRFPESDTVAEFAEHLMNGDDLITEDNRRWEPGFYELPKRHGKLKDLKKFDAAFFGVPPKQANAMDPQLRILLEVVHEAILDSGYNPQLLRGTKVGVFVGCSASETASALTQDAEAINGYSLTGCTRSMFANRLSYAFDFRGPSFAVDTACSSSLIALQLAVDSIRQDQCDAAVVAGTHLTLMPNSALQFLRLGMLSKEGTCKTFDADGDGYVRGESIAAIFIQKSSDSRRCYATVVHAKSNTDGYKQQGITFPSGAQQAVLLEEVYREAGIDPRNVVYVETHGTGTKVGDPEECSALTEVFCRDRDEPLLVGSVKSSMGHAEPASGLCSIAKVLIAMESGIIPPNLHYKSPNPYIPALVDGRLKVVCEPTKWNGGLVAVNSFGFGGSNTHVLLRSRPHAHTPGPNQSPNPTVPTHIDVPKLMCYAARTIEGVQTVFEAANKHLNNPYLYAMLSEQSNMPVTQCPYRGFTIMNRDKAQAPLCDVQKLTTTDPRQVWFVYSGMGSQWPGMGQELMRLDVFKQSVLRCSEALRPLGVDPYSLIMKGDEEVFKDTMHCMTCITAIQIAITDVLKLIGIEPDGIVGHSTGEMACGYADGCLTREQTMLLAYYRGYTVMHGGLSGTGGMAAVGLGWEETKKRLPEGVIAACHNAADSVTVSGDYEKVMNFVDELKREEIFAKFVPSSGVPFHSPAMQKIKGDMLQAMEEIIPEPKKRTSRWISTSVPEENWKDAQMCTAAYQVNNAMNPVLFYDGIKKIPENAVAVEIAPHALLQAILRRSLPSTCANVGLMKAKHENQLEFFLSALGKVHQAGVPVRVQELYGTVPYPVPRGTPMISPLVKWDHSIDWPVVNAKDMASSGGGGIAASTSFTIDPYAPDSKEKYVLDHIIDGRVLFPFTGHVVLAWKAVAKIRATDFQKTPILIENMNVFRPTILSGKPVKFDVVFAPGGEYFEILEQGSLTANGYLRVIEEPTPCYYEHMKPVPEDMICDRIAVETPDIYKEFILRGYEYGPAFRGICRTRNSGLAGTLYWNGNWVTFLDSLLQSALIAERQDTLRLPVRLRYMRIDPVKHMECIVNKGDMQLIELRNDIPTNGCCAGGVESADLVVQNVQRRLHAAGKAILEKIQFVKLDDPRCLELLPQQRESLTRYKQVLTGVVAEGLMKWHKTNAMKQLPGHHMIESALKELQKRQPSIEAHILNECMERSECQLLGQLQNMFSLSSNEADWLDRVKTTAKTAYATITHDLLYSASYTQRSMKPIVDMAMENTGGHFNRFTALEPLDVDVVRNIVDVQITHPLVESEWFLLGPNVGDVNLEAMNYWPTELINPAVPPAEKLNLDTTDAPDHLKEKSDTVLAAFILHKKTDIPRYLQKMKQFIRDDGLAIVIEVTSDFELALAAEAMTMEELPAVGDSKRIYGMYLRHEDWMKEFEDAGFVVAAFNSDPSMISTVYLLHRVPSTPKQKTFVDVDDVTDFGWIETLKETMEANSGPDTSKTIWLTNTKIRDNGALGLALCLREEGGKSNRIRSVVDVSLAKRDGEAEIDMDGEQMKNLMRRDLHAYNYRDGEWGSFRHMVVSNDEMYAHKMCEHAYINTLVKGDMSTLCWQESSNQYFDPSLLPEHQRNYKMCSVYFAPVNFRDVMLASGKLPSDAIPGTFSDRDCLLGLEFSGRDTKTGERLMGILPARGLATTVIVSPDYSWPVPSAWTMQEAATVPVVYCTAYYALVIRANIKQGESVLIHSGTGGVGQASIAVALSRGCRVFTTVGSEEKKKFLLKTFPQLDASCISNSRSTKFEWDIRQATAGKGVDVVLNSLSDDKLQASLRCLAQHGRFLEIGKFDLSKNTALGMALFLKNITFHGILLDALMDGDNDDWNRVSTLFKQGIQQGVVKPLHNSAFPSSNVEEAFRYMASGKHVGKVIVQIRPEDQGDVMPCPVKVRAVSRTICDPHCCYLITGGLGGFGLELAQWLINRGAKKLVLTTRSGIRNGYQARCLYFWRRIGIQIVISTLNIAHKDEAQRLIEECQELGPLGGLFHLAMVLRDCVFENQNVNNFREAAEAKYWGTKNLDMATRSLDKDLFKWFVVFSSITSGRGNTGQTNYGWANCTMERIVEQRRYDGYPGIAIQWGAIGDVGVIIENMGDNSTVVGGTLPQRMPSCLQCLDLFITWDYPIVSSYIRAELGGNKSTGNKGDVIQAIANIIGVSDVAQLDLNASLGDLGLDSLMGVEIKQALERDFDIVLSMKDIRTMTLAKLKNMSDGGIAEVAADAVAVRASADEADKQKEQEELERQMHQLFKLRIDVNDLLSFDKLVKISKVPEASTSSSTQNIFFVHSIEGIATPLKKLGAKLKKMPAYVFQCTPECPLDSIESMARYYIKVMREKQPIGPYKLVGYSYGACIAFEMACRLEAEDPALLDGVVLLDGSHHYMKAYKRMYRMTYGVNTETLANNPLFETEVMCAYALRFANIDYKKMRAELLAQPGWKARVQKVVDYVMPTGLFKSAETLAWSCDSLRAKFVCADKYEPSRKLNANLVLIRAGQMAGREEDVGHDYGLSEAVNGTVDVRVIDGDHDSFVQGVNSVKTAALIDELLSR